MAKRNKIKDPFAKREAAKYENPIPSREYILDYLVERGRPATYPDLIHELHLQHPETEEALRRRLIAMVRDGQLLKNRKGAYGPLSAMEVISGIVVGHKDGFGFVEYEGGEDLFLTPRQMRSVFHGDRVLVRVAHVDNRGRREGMIVEVLERNTKQLVGRFYKDSGMAYVEPSHKRIQQDIFIPEDNQNNALHGQMVVVAITDYPTERARPIGKIVEVLGDHMAPGMEIDVAIRSYDLPYIWPDQALSEAGQFAAEVAEADLVDRTDFRDMPFVTIDGEDAKDFDDAVYCDPKPTSGWILYVAIADVSYYVKKGMVLDQEAYQRGNSVYFPGRVIPMLPETLSNNLCSLNPAVDRLVMVCKMQITATGRISRYEFFNGVIHSKARLTYKQVHQMMEKKDRRMRERFKDLLPHMEALYALFRVLHQARAKRGAIDFDMPETKVVFGRDRKIEKIVPYERFISHRVIEECMLSANICAAKFLKKNKKPALYRIHEGPTAAKLKNLQQFLQEIGLKMPTHRDPTPSDYAHILRVVADRPDANMIQTILLRSMSQAIYGPDNKGHFGLAYDEYAHFTSPIRRYPDLLIHRAIKELLNKKRKFTDDENFLVKAGEHCSMTERRADEATRDVSDWLKCEFMMDKIGLEFAGNISGVMNFGVFVELADIYVEGLVHISALPNDYYQFDPIHHTLFGGRSGKEYRLGHPIKIRVARVDLDKREMDFVLASTPLSEMKVRKTIKKNAKEEHGKSNVGNNKNKPRLKKSFKKTKKSRRR